MDRLRDVLNGTWSGTYSPSGVNTQMSITATLSPNGESLSITGSGRDGYGVFTLEGTATSPTEISCIKNLGLWNEWWHRGTVDIDRKRMSGTWGPKSYLNA